MSQKTFQDNFEEILDSFVSERNIHVEELTKQQFASAIQQMIACGDFVRYMDLVGDKQSVVYIPFAREQQLMAQIAELKALLKQQEPTHKPPC